MIGSAKEVADELNACVAETGSVAGDPSCSTWTLDYTHPRDGSTGGHYHGYMET
jgi:hypothetical protein